MGFIPAFKKINYIHSLFFKKNSYFNNLKFTHHSIIKKQGVCHTMALPFTLKSILRQKKNYGNSNISPCKKIKKSSKRNQNRSKYCNFVTNLKLQHKPKISSSKNPHIKNRPKLPKGQNPLSYYTL
jgi:hypothetical protein